MLVYAVERKSGAPREGVQVQVIRKKLDVVKGATDGQGLLKLQVVEKKPPAKAGEDEAEAEEGEAEGEGEAETEAESQITDSYLFMATQGENFAISDLDSYYFSG